MKALDDKKTLEQNIKLKEELEKERTEWTNKIIPLVEMLKDNKKLTEAQVVQLSYRHWVQEKIANYKILIEERKGKLDVLQTSRFREYSISYDLKLNGTEKNAFVNADCSALKQQVNMIDTQIKYFEECIKTLDNFGFAVRNKIEIISQQIM